MGKVQNGFGNGSAGAVSRSVDDIVITVKNAGDREIPFGAPVFLASGGAVPFNPESPQDFESFLGFAVRIPDMTPEVYPSGQHNESQEGNWKPGETMEVLVRGGIVVSLTGGGEQGGKVYIRKSDGALTAAAGQTGSTVQLENVRVRTPRGAFQATTEVVVNKRNIL